MDEVRKAWHLDNFYLYGQSWGGMLAMEYAARSEYRKHLKGLINSNMLYSMKEYTPYIRKYRDRALAPDEVKYMHHDEKTGQDQSDPKYAKLCMKFYHQCICRLPKWPEDVWNAFKHVSPQVYVYMQGPSEFTIVGTLKNWSIKNRLKNIDVPTLVLSGKYDSMNPKAMKKTAELFPNAKFHLCPKGSHFSIWDDQKDYFNAIDKYLKAVENGTF